MSELLPCAFCGEEARGIVEGIVFCDCGASAPISVWNTRAERTCNLIETSRDEITCETCDCCVYLGEGDFACDERDYEHVIEDWVSLREPCEKWTRCEMAYSFTDIRKQAKDAICSNTKELVMRVSETPKEGIYAYEEVQPIVRCRDCRYMHTVRSWLGNDVDECWLHASPETGALGKEWTEPDGFCAWGERKR